MNDKPTNVGGLLLSYEKILAMQYSPKPSPKCVPVIQAFLEKHSISEKKLTSSAPFKFYMLTFILHNMCSDWDETKILLQKMKDFPVRIFMTFTNLNTETLKDYKAKVNEESSGKLQSLPHSLAYPRRLSRWHDLYQNDFSKKILEIFSKHKLFPPVEWKVLEEVRNYLPVSAFPEM